MEAFTCVLLPGRPPRCIVLESGEIIPVRVKARSPMVERVLSSSMVRETLVYYSPYLKYTVEKRALDGSPSIFNVTYRYTVIARDTYTELKSARSVRSMILESCKPYIVEFDREYTVGTVVWEAPYIKEFYYVSTNKISRIDVKHERQYRRVYGKRYYTEKCRRVIWNRFRALLIS